MEGARSAYKESLAILMDLTSRDRTNSRWQEDLANAASKLDAIS
jgi:hypothetical protein